MKYPCAKALTRVLLLLSGSFALSGLAGESLKLTSGHSDYNPAPHMEYLSSRVPLTIEQLRTETQGWTPLQRPFFHHERSRREFWFRLKLHRPVSESSPGHARTQRDLRSWYFSIISNRLDHVDLYVPENGTYRVIHDGDQAEWKPDRLAPYPVFLLNLEPGEHAVYYLRVQSETMLLSFRPLISAPRQFGARRALEQSVQILALFLLTVYLLYCGTMFYFRRNIAYVHLAIVALGFCLYGFTIIGDINLVLWSRNPYLRNTLNLVWAVLTLFFFLQFASRLLQTQDQFHILHWCIRIASGACLAFFPLIFSGFSNHVLSIIIITIQLSTISLVFIAAIRNLLRKRWYVLYFLLSFGMMMLAAASHTLMLLDVLPYNFLTAYAGYLVSPLEFVSISIAMTARYRSLTRERSYLLEEQRDNNTEENSRAYSYPTLKRIKNVDAKQLVRDLRRLAEQEQVFYKERVSLKSVARKLRVRPDQLSAVLNSELRLSFNDLVNEYRVEFARRLLGEHEELSVLEIAFMSGFSSRTNFNRVFKKSTGYTPVEFRRKQARRS